MTKDRTTRLRVLLAQGLALSAAALALPAAAYTPPANTTQFRLEACRNDANTVLPNVDGDFICPDSQYTTGNLKTWAELDLVPHRLTTETGNTTGAYNVIVAADYRKGTTIGYDVLALLQTDSAGCSVSWGDQLSSDKADTGTGGGTGGADEVIYRVMTITQPANSTCVINWVNRLAIGAAGFSGSSLQSYMFEQENLKTGRRTLSLPVNTVLPQQLNKTMAAAQDTAYGWTLNKAASAAKVQFNDTCNVDEPLEKSVNIKIEWERLPGAPGAVNIKTTIKATNPATRPVLVTVTDKIYAGTTLLDTKVCAEATVPPYDPEAEVPANTADYTVCTHEFTAAADVTDLNDVATATYRDEATEIAIPGTTTATASTMIAAGDESNETATIFDTESLTGTGLTFKVTGTTAGSADGTFDPTLPMAFTQGPVKWTSGTQSGAGFVEFNKTVKVPYATATSGTLTDTATLTGIDGYGTSGNASVAIYAYARVSLTIKKTIPDILQGTDTVTFSFVVTRPAEEAGDPPVTVASETLTFEAGDTYKEVVIADLDPGVTYTVTETPATGWAVDPDTDTQQNVTINLPDCAGSVSFYNDIAPGEFAKAKVKKVTLPAGSESGWTFSLQRCAKFVDCADDDFTEVSTLTTTGGDFEIFEDLVGELALLEGTYRVKETEQAGWDNLGGVGSYDAEAPFCEFKVDYPASIGQTYTCTYTNRQRGTIIIKKVTVPAETDDPTSFSFTENIVGDGFSLVHGGQKKFEDVVTSQSYVVTEGAKAGYVLTSLVCVDSATGTASTVSLADRKATVNLDPGETVTCTFTNTKQGKVALLKLTNGVQDPSMVWTFTLKGTGVNASDWTPPALLDFGGVDLVPNEVYKICETGIPPGWTQLWYVDANGNGSIDMGEMPLPLATPFGPGNVNNVLLTVYDPDPNYGTPNAVNDSRCVDFKVGPGETLKLILDNTRPGGEPRTIGYWKNWSSCTGGGQAAKAAANGGFQNGWWLIDNVLPQSLGSYLTVVTCTEAVNILSKSTIDTRKNMASDAAYGLAAQLLAAKANLYAGAETCSAVTSAVASADALLSGIKFDGKKSFLPSSVKGPLLTTRNSALTLANTLDQYNNGHLCQ